MSVVHCVTRDHDDQLEAEGLDLKAVLHITRPRVALRYTKDKLHRITHPY